MPRIKSLRPCPSSQGLGSGCGISDHPVFLCEECHSDSDFFLIFFQDCVQERKEVLNLLRVFLCGYIHAELPDQISVIHRVPERDSPMQGGRVEYRRCPMTAVLVQMRAFICPRNFTRSISNTLATEPVGLSARLTAASVPWRRLRNASEVALPNLAH
jgi:hypothetical protein